MDIISTPPDASIAITELEPVSGKFIGKKINRGGGIEQYPIVKMWRQAVAIVPATIPHVFEYLRSARERNVCLIRGAPADLNRKKTRRWRAGVHEGKDRGDHGFLDEPSRLLSLDPDGVAMNWMADPEGAVRSIVARLGEPWASASYVWFFSGTHGLERDKDKRWTGRIVDGTVRLRLVFITDRALDEGEATALTNIAAVHAPELKLDLSISRTVQPNYIRRPHWVEHPDRDVLGDIPTIGWVQGEHEYLAVPEGLTETARWARAQGVSVNIADHPDAETAVRSIGSDGSVRGHIQAAVIHLLRANPIPEDASAYEAHSRDITAKLAEMVEQHREEIAADVDGILQNLKPSFALWCLNHQGILNRKTIKLVKEGAAAPVKETTREEIIKRVQEQVGRVRKGDGGNIWINYGNRVLERPLQQVLPAPTGSTKSTQIRANAVRYVEENPTKSVVILMPRHQLGNEQIKLLHKEHPGRNFSAAVWRGRHA